MIYQHTDLADSAGAMTAWKEVTGGDPLTVHFWGGHASDVWRIWGTTEDAPTNGTVGNAVEVASSVNAAKGLVVVSPFNGRISIELDTRGGAGTRKVRVVAIPRGSN